MIPSKHKVPLQLSSEEGLPETAVKARKRFVIVGLFIFHFACSTHLMFCASFRAIEQPSGHVQVKNR